MSNNEEPREEVDVPPTALVHCPLVAFKLRAAQQCIGCEHHHGMTDRFPGAANLSFVQRYRVTCSARPTLREMQELAL